MKKEVPNRQRMAKLIKEKTGVTWTRWTKNNGINYQQFKNFLYNNLPINGKHVEMYQKLQEDYYLLLAEEKSSDKVPPEFCIKIEQRTNGALTRYELRPDIFGTSPNLPKDCFLSESQAKKHFGFSIIPAHLQGIKINGKNYWQFSILQNYKDNKTINSYEK